MLPERRVQQPYCTDMGSVKSGVLSEVCAWVLWL